MPRWRPSSRSTQIAARMCLGSILYQPVSHRLPGAHKSIALATRDGQRAGSVVNFPWYNLCIVRTYVSASATDRTGRKGSPLAG
ncbi:hypothetical protein R1flu_003163 [Riccia fluitans]|uniref:Uncharacterized protein n=1 Tax=Riccia fluitans TaxID=41844 RepID=A0ABD1Y881_9MARC